MNQQNNAIWTAPNIERKLDPKDIDNIESKNMPAWNNSNKPKHAEIVFGKRSLNFRMLSTVKIISAANA